MGHTGRVSAGAMRCVPACHQRGNLSKALRAPVDPNPFGTTMGPCDKQNKILQGLAQVLGLEAEADPVAVLKTVAATLGCTVHDDGTTMLMEVSAILVHAV